MFKKFEISKSKIPQQIAEHIINLISKGSLKPGDKLPSEKQLEEMFGVSRPSVREALSALSMGEIIEMRHGEGSFVRDIDFNTYIHPLAIKAFIKSGSVYELLETRILIEGEIAALAASRGTEEDACCLKNELKRMEKEIKLGRLAVELDLDFHLCLAKAAKNNYLLEIIKCLSEPIHNCQKYTRQYSRLLPGQPQEVLEQHFRIVDAVFQKKPGEAKAAMVNHLEKVIDKCRYIEEL